MNVLKRVILPAAFVFAATTAHADVVDLGELSPGVTPYTATVAAGAFSTDYTFSLANLTSGVFSLNQLPLTNTGVAVFDFSSLKFDLYSVADGWQAGAVAGGEFSFANLAAGDYYVTVAGNANGAFGGIYAGSISIAAVPEPSSIAMLMIGFAALGAVARRRQNKL